MANSIPWLTWPFLSRLPWRSPTRLYCTMDTSMDTSHTLCGRKSRTYSPWFGTSASWPTSGRGELESTWLVWWLWWLHSAFWLAPPAPEETRNVRKHWVLFRRKNDFPEHQCLHGFGGCTWFLCWHHLHQMKKESLGSTGC